MRTRCTFYLPRRTRELFLEFGKAVNLVIRSESSRWTKRNSLYLRYYQVRGRVIWSRRNGRIMVSVASDLITVRKRGASCSCSDAITMRQQRDEIVACPVRIAQSVEQYYITYDVIALSTRRKANNIPFRAVRVFGQKQSPRRRDDGTERTADRPGQERDRCGRETRLFRKRPVNTVFALLYDSGLKHTVRGPFRCGPQ